MHSDTNTKPIRDVLRVLEICGKLLGYQTEREWRVPMGLIDLVWYNELLIDLPQFNVSRLPIVAFELETSWRTRKHIKGDLLNFQAIHAALGVIVQLTGSNDDPRQIKSLISNTRGYIKTIGMNSMTVWTKADVVDLAESLGVLLDQI